MKTLWLLIRRTVQEYGDDNCSHMAAAISYYVLFSIIPLAIFLISIFGLVVRDEERQQDIAAEIVSFLDVEEGDFVLKPDEGAIEALYGAGAVEEIREALWNEDPSPSGSDRLLEQYKLYVEMADRISQRRGAANTCFLTFNTAVVGALAGFYGSHRQGGTPG